LEVVLHPAAAAAVVENIQVSAGLRAAAVIAVVVEPSPSGSSLHSEVTCPFGSYAHAPCSEKDPQIVPSAADLDLAAVDSMDLIVQAYPHCSVVNVPSWVTGMDRALVVAAVVEDVRSLMVEADVAAVDQASRN
jgi:hypothetical protein